MIVGRAVPSALLIHHRFWSGTATATATLLKRFFQRSC
jgi:hypothetical protein